MKFPLVEGYLELAGVTIDQACERLGIKRRTFYNKVNGISDFTVSEMIVISQLAGKTMDDIFLPKNVT